jgi:drug/metabolite transporter (DMT)-like permease
VNRRGAYLLLILGALCFSFNGIVSKWVMEAGLTPWRLTQVRSTGGFIAMLCWLLARGRISELKTNAREIKMLIPFGLFGIASVQTFYFLSILKLHVSIALIIEFTAPFWIALYLRFIRKEKVSNTVWIGLAFAFVGLILVAQVWQGLTLNGVGVIAAFVDAFSLAIYFLLARALGYNRNGETLTTWGFAVTTLLYLIIQPIWNFPWHIFTQSMNLNGHFSGHHLPGWVLILWVCIMGTLVPYLSVIIGITRLSATTASVVGMLEPVLAGIFGWILLRETFTTIQLIGAAIVLVGIYIANERIPEGDSNG